MNDVDQALAQIADIRARVAASTRYRGFAPEAVAVAGLFAVIAATAQTLWPDRLAGDPVRFVQVWGVVIASSFAIILSEAFLRARIVHGDQAAALTKSAAIQATPFAITQAAVAIAVCLYAPEAAWIVPGLWLILVGLSGFTAVTHLPRTVRWAAAWYIASGVAVLFVAGHSGAATPWMMGVPLAVGHGLIALILHRAEGDLHG